MPARPAHPWGRAALLTAALVAAACAAAVPLALRVRVDNRIERWLDTGGRAARDYRTFRERFGSDDFVLLAYAGRPLFEPGSLEAQLEALEVLEGVPGLSKPLGIPAIHRDLLGGQDPELLRREILEIPFYRNFLVSPDGSMAGLLAPVVDSEVAPERLVDGVREAGRVLERAGFTVHLVGPPVLNVALDRSSRAEAFRSFPVAFGLSVGVLLALFRCLRATGVAVLCAGLGILLTLGAMGAARRPLDMVTSVLPSLLFVLSLAANIHVLSRYRAHRLETDGALPAIARALAETARPCVLASVTTAVGFASLGTARMEPVRALGALAAFGLLASLAVNLLLGPVLVAMVDPPGAGPRSAAGFARLARAVAGPRGGRRIAVLAAGFALLLGLGLARLRVESDPLTFLPASSPTVRDYEEVARRLTGFYTLELMVETPGGWLDPAKWPALDAVARQLEARPDVARVLSPLDLLRLHHHWSRGPGPETFALPATAGAARELLEDFGGGVGDLRLAASDGSAVRLAALVRVMPSDRFREIEKAARRALAALPDPWSGTPTGIVLRLVEAQLGLVRTQVESFGIAFGLIFLCIGLGLRSLRLTVVSVPPNLLPILAALGAMGFAAIRLDAATVMVASVALGIAVDDTVHLLEAWRSEREAPPDVALERALVRVGPAMVVTTATACIGFGALLVSSFLPIRWFGALSALAMAVALAADVLLAPVLALRLAPASPGALARSPAAGAGDRAAPEGPGGSP